MVSLDYLLYHLGDYEELIYQNEESFLKRFGKQYDEIIHVRFGSEVLEFVVLTDCGAHVVDGIKIEEFKEWIIECTK